MSIFAALEVYHDSIPRSAAMNMAIDEALLEFAKVPSLRFYRWDHAALSFGYFGRYADVALYEPERDLVRRWTGGGIVLHGKDLTYSLVIPAHDSSFANSSRSIYTAIHEGIRAALMASGKPAELVTVAGVVDTGTAITDPPKAGYNTGHCFANPVRADVLVNGQKVAGAAQRRTRTGLLQQGSIQQVALTEDFGDKFAVHLTQNCEHRDLSEVLVDRADQIAKEKYGTATWLKRR
jgi:lipoate-protein ligase A